MAVAAAVAAAAVAAVAVAVAVAVAGRVPTTRDAQLLPARMRFQFQMPLHDAMACGLTPYQRAMLLRVSPQRT